MDKEIIWIDDRVDDMEQIVEGMFCELWKHGVGNRTLFFGDAIREVDDERLDKYRLRVCDVFFALYEKHTSHMNNMNSDEREICENLKAVYVPIEGDDPCWLADRIPLYEDKIKKTIERWKNGIERDAWNVTEELPKEYNLDAIWECMNPKITGAVALDIILLNGDESKLNCEEKLAHPVISMEFYRYITQELQLPCILYSRYTYLNRLQYNWGRLYKSRYDKEQEPPKIYPRRALYKGEINRDVQKILLDHAQMRVGTNNG